MKVIETVSEMRHERARMGGRLGFVPTMGALHEGHLSLVRRARQDNHHVVVSIFVNPTQFGPQEDFEGYPRDCEGALRLLEQERADVAFTPPAEEMYPPGFDEWVEVSGPLATRLEGAARLGHFRGVTTVVARLLRIVEPQRAYFGEKDAQQLRVVRRMVRELGLPVEIVAMPTVRDADGLALSSRNAYLSPEDRRSALVIPRALDLARKMVATEGVHDAKVIRQAVANLFQHAPVETPRRGVSTPKVHLEYVSIADDETLEELAVIDRPALVLLAARVGPASPAGRPTRLIDNALLLPGVVEAPEALLETIDDLKAATWEHGGAGA